MKVKDFKSVAVMCEGWKKCRRDELREGGGVVFYDRGKGEYRSKLNLT